jgi:hypothetical protein
MIGEPHGTTRVTWPGHAVGVDAYYRPRFSGVPNT